MHHSSTCPASRPHVGAGTITQHRYTAAAGAPAKFYCQFRGEGEFAPVWLTLSDVDDNGVRVLEVRQDSPERTLLREADVSGCKVMKPRFGRNVSQLEAGKKSYARRIDLARRDSEGDLKYIIATDCCETLDAWIGAFAEPTEAQELTDEERKQLKKLYTELTSIRKLGAISYDAGNLVEVLKLTPKLLICCLPLAHAI